MSLPDGLTLHLIESVMAHDLLSRIVMLGR